MDGEEAKHRIEVVRPDHREQGREVNQIHWKSWRSICVKVAPDPPGSGSSGPFGFGFDSLMLFGTMGLANARGVLRG
jgi:hypothetical protein